MKHKLKSEQDEREEPCPECESGGKWQIGDGSLFDCPFCNGTGFKQEESNEEILY